MSSSGVLFAVRRRGAAAARGRGVAAPLPSRPGFSRPGFAGSAPPVLLLLLERRSFGVFGAFISITP
jgi:hypothetical protein